MPLTNPEPEAAGSRATASAAAATGASTPPASPLAPEVMDTLRPPPGPPAALGRLTPAPLDYELLAEIARGGMGIVYKARQRKLNRIVALKVISTGQLASQEEAQRFKAEAEAAAQLDHPHIVPVYEVGEANGVQFFSMAFVEGQSFAQLVAEAPIPPRQAATLMRQVATAVAYAHARGVIHRDLKPANILLDAVGQPRVTDFGLAKWQGTESNLTQTGQIVGTPGFMPPEQAEGKIEQVGIPADIYSLGATLYCLLTGRPPFQAASVVETLKQVVERDPVPPRRVNPAVDLDLDTICLKCLEKRPERRYASAEALADDLGRFLDDRPIHARRVGELEKLVRWCRRRPLDAALLAAIVVVFLTAFALVSWSYWRAEDARKAEAHQRQEAERKEKAERWERYRANLAAATSAFQLHNVGAARRALEAAPEEHRNWEWRHFYHQLDGARHVLRGHEGPVGTVMFTPDGRRLGTAGLEKTVRLWDVGERREMAVIHPDPAHGEGMTLSPDGKTIAVIMGDPTIHLWDVAAGRLRVVLRGHEKPIHKLRFSPDGTRLGSGCEDRTARVWDVMTGDQLQVLRGHKGAVTAVEFSPDGRRLVTVSSADRSAWLWDVDTGRRIAILDGHEAAVRQVAFSPDGKRVVTAEDYPGNALRLWDAASGKPIAVLRGHSNQAMAMAFSPDGKRLASAALDSTVRLWDAVTGQPLATLAKHSGWVLGVAFSPDGRRLVSASQDHTLRLWDAASGTPLAVLLGHTREVVYVAYSPDGSLIASASADGTARVWDARLAERSGVLRGHKDFVYGVAFHPDGARVASAA
ncbi:MAG TPA: protein kinase, partial [Gemmataceae bacterium]|nr:protein kinase [Gemmataceae bacterium]